MNFQLVKTLVLLLIVSPFLASCGNGETPVNPVDPIPNNDVMPDDIDRSYLDPKAQERNLFVKGAVKSGVIDTLDSHAPFIIFSMRDDDFRAYLTEQGVSESEFLASPDLRAFYEAHVIGDTPNLYQKVSVEGVVIEEKTLSGKTVTFENRDDGFDNGRGRVFVDGLELDEAPLNENNTNYDWVLSNRPIVDFPIE